MTPRKQPRVKAVKALHRPIETPLERARLYLAEYRELSARSTGSKERAEVFAKLIAVAEAGLKIQPTFNLVADGEIELDDALSALTKPDGE